jgi:hypothetical protein
MHVNFSGSSFNQKETPTKTAAVSEEGVGGCFVANVLAAGIKDIQDERKDL